jgi:hypothetical protein
MMIQVFDQAAGRSCLVVLSSPRRPLRQGCPGVPAADGLRARAIDERRTISSGAIVAGTLFAGGSVVMQAIDQMNPANSRAIAVTTTCLGLPFAIMWR